MKGNIVGVFYKGNQYFPKDKRNVIKNVDRMVKGCAFIKILNKEIKHLIKDDKDIKFVAEVEESVTLERMNATHEIVIVNAPYMVNFQDSPTEHHIGTISMPYNGKIVALFQDRERRISYLPVKICATLKDKAGKNTVENHCADYTTGKDGITKFSIDIGVPPSNVISLGIMVHSEEKHSRKGKEQNSLIGYLEVAVIHYKRSGSALAISSNNENIGCGTNQEPKEHTFNLYVKNNARIPIQNLLVNWYFTSGMYF